MECKFYKITKPYDRRKRYNNLLAIVKVKALFYYHLSSKTGINQKRGGTTCRRKFKSI